MDPQQTSPQDQVTINIHQQKLFALIGAAIAFIALLLPWLSLGGLTLKNGLEDWGLLTLLGVLAVFVVSFLGTKTQPYDENYRKLAMAAFAAMILGALFTLITKDNFVRTGFGVWLSIITGVAGLAWLAGIIKLPPKTPPPPPPPGD